MRGYPLDLDVLCRKIAAVRWDRHLRAMQRGWMDVWREEWRFLWNNLPEGNEHADNIRRKMIGGVSEDGQFVQGRNKLYITKKEQPWLMAWLEEQMLPTCDKCGKHTDEIFIWGDAGDEGFCRPCFQEVA